MSNSERYHEIIQRQVESPLGQLQLAGRIFNSEGGMIRYRSLECYALVYLNRGEGVYQSPGAADRQLREGDSILILPNRPHCYNPSPGSQWDETYITFSGPIFDLWCKELEITENSFAQHTSLDSAMGLIDRIPQSSEKSPEATLIQIQSLINQHLNRSSFHSHKGRETWVERASRLVTESDQPFKSIASTLGTEYNTFRKRFAEETGSSPLKLRNAAKLGRAARLLNSSTLPITEIAQELGFSSNTYFTQFFKKHSGMSPRDYRRALRKGEVRPFPKNRL